MDYHLQDKVAVVTGAGGAIGSEIARSLCAEGAKVAVWDIALEAARNTATEIGNAGGVAIGVECDVLSKEKVAAALEQTLSEFGTVDILINGAGGSRPEATTSPEQEFFDIEPEALHRVFDLNYMSAVIPSQAVGRVFADNKSGVILNISSIGAILPLTRSISYSNGKAATSNFTQWLAVHMAQTYSTGIRVNALAPGFCLTAQNRFLMIDEETKELTARGNQVIAQVPMARFGDPAEIACAALWLVSDNASFVTGAVIPIDGGITAFLGV